MIVNLGTNDASAFDQPQWVDEVSGEAHKMRRNPDGSYNMQDMRTLQQAVKDFIALIRECNPNAQIVWCYGMLGTNIQLYLCEAVAEYVTKTGDRRVSYLQLPNTTSESVGSREHPGYLSHQRAADVLAGYLAEIL